MSYDGSTDGAGAQTVWEIAVSVGEDQLELTSDLLWSLGATALEERPASPGAALVVTMSDRAAAEHFLGSLLAPTTGVDPSTVNLERREFVASQSWRDHARWHRIAPDLLVGPSWLEAPVPGDAIAIEPAGSFGLGDHPTSGISLAETRALVRPGDRVIDLGAGSGVLSIAAVLRGAVEVCAIDISPEAVAAARLNIKMAGCADRVTTILDGTGAAAVAAFDGSADLLVANILAPELVALAGPIDAAVAPSGRLVLSGFPEARIPFVNAAFPDWVESRRRIRGNWCALVLRRR
ncbi:MAG: methyltransferase domain-containing protein [Actinobacteria bacterium]|nr:methyltransferase domain-containing protein [Actinomycetota bacterium]